jgi:hypothetical protein
MQSDLVPYWYMASKVQSASSDAAERAIEPCGERSEQTVLARHVPAAPAAAAGQ